MRRSLPIIVSTAALVVAVLGATPFGQAAGRAVQRAAFAENAAKVNGFEASSTPRPNALLALDAKAKVPASVIPMSAKRTGQFFFRTLGAIVLSNGTLVRSFPAGAATSTRLSEGRYRVAFNANVRNCLQIATIRIFGSVEEPIGEHINVAPNASPNAIIVHTLKEPSGTSLAVGSDSGFNIAVFCPLFPF
jgi:hypothetical protein